MFQSLGNKLNDLISNFTKSGIIKESDIDNFISQIRNSLLDADTHPDAVEYLAEELKKQAIGTQIHKALNAKQQLTKLVHNSLTNILGNKIEYAGLGGAERVLLVGLQGSGKTTTVAKLAQYFKKTKNKNPFLRARYSKIFKTY